MTLIIWIFLAVISFIYIGYPVFIHLLGLLQKKYTIQEEIEPSIAFLIKANNQEKNIARKIENTLRLEYPQDKIRIIVISNSSIDRTNEIVRAYSNLRVELISSQDIIGDSELVQQVIKKCGEEILIFSDAETELLDDAVNTLVQNFSDPMVGYVKGSNNTTFGKIKACRRAFYNSIPDFIDFDTFSKYFLPRFPLNILS